MTGAAAISEPLVVDASFVAALVFGDIDHVRASDYSAWQFVAPTLIRHEFMQVCIEKFNAGRIDANGALDALAGFDRLGIGTSPVSSPETLAMAIRFNVSAYDAAYLWMAIDRRLTLLTLDGELEKTWRRAAKELNS